MKQLSAGRPGQLEGTRCHMHLNTSKHSHIIQQKKSYSVFLISPRGSLFSSAWEVAAFPYAP